MRDDDIAVIGLACRLPGAPSPDAFWRLLVDGVDAVTDRPGSGPGGYLDAVDLFDPAFFGVSPREAARMDPRQRLVLELGWEGLEDAGVVPDSLRGQRVGVHIGVMDGDYAEVTRAHPATSHTFTGQRTGMIANRVSHRFGFTGPSLTVDTGQSSSLTAVHLACESLRSGESTLALAGGVNLLLGEESRRATEAFGALSPDGRCFTFDAGANGFVRGEGAGLVVLKPLAAALADGDRVHCVIRGSAVNHDGADGGFTVPNPAAQREVLRLAYERAGLDPTEVDYVELHGTGTPVGDPVEAAALGAVLGATRGADRPLRVGSVKTNIGHLEGAAGIAGLLKAVLAVRHGEVPPSLHFHRPNPAIPLAELGLRVAVDREPWAGPRTAGVSSFGMGGANCHVVLGQAPPPSGPVLPPAVSPVSWFLSARTPEALRDQAVALRAHVEANPGPRNVDIAYSLARTRTTFEHRAVITASRRADFLHGLDAVAAGERVVGGEAAMEDVDWEAAGGRRVALPTYRFQRERYWIGDERATATTVTPPSADRLSALLLEVRQQVAVVLEHPDAAAVAPDSTFEQLGVDSAAAVEIEERLADVLGRAIPSSLVYDHPTPRAVAAFLAAEPVSNALPRPTTAGSDEPIALVGIGCRFPGGIRSAEDLWDVVAGERDVLGGFPTDRGWDLDRLFGSTPDGRGTSSSREGGFLHDAAEFDAGFFGISPREALAMDPQQRLLLEVGWEAVERAGIDPLSLRGTPTGVFVGVIPQQYDTNAERSADNLDGYVYTGTTTSVLAGRVAYSLGLEGPALAVDTACSSSLVALHLACQSLRQGECSLALAGGVTVMATPLMFVEFSKQGALSADGRSKAFAAAADGTGWSEGVGLVVLEKLSDARRHGHEVLAVVRGSAINEDGASNGLTAPNGPAQQRVVRQAVANARLSTQDVDVVEAHGPGTTLGDPIEANALIATYGVDRDPERPLWLGSVKSNLGHTQAAAGVAGVIKTVMAMRHGVLPRTLHVDEPTRHVDWSSGTVRVLTEARPWPATDRPRRAGVSAFGAGGTNAHVVLESVPAVNREPLGADNVVAWPLSAKTPQAVADQASRLRDHLLAHPDLAAADVAATLARRADFEHRAVVVGADRAELLAALANPETTSAAPTGPVFVFPGQGSQWVGMADGLLDVEPVFTAAAHECAAAFEEFLDWSVLDVLRGLPGTPPLDRVDVVQPALFTMMVSLAAWWRSHGVEPAAVVGHSQGEIAAACVAGALSLQDGARIIALRSRALLDLSGRGAMASLPLSAEEARERLRPWNGKVEVAAVNGPAATTVGGDPAALEELLAVLTAEGVRFRRLPGVTNAGHSAQVEVLREHLLDVLEPVRPRPATVPFYSTVTGGHLDPTTLDADYWWRNAREPVLFEPATRALLDAGHRVFIEVNPHPLLHSALAESTATVLGTLRRDDDPRRRMVTSLAEAYRHGCPVDWTIGHPEARIVPLPTYAFRPTRFWAVPTAVGGTSHPLISADLPLPHVDGHLLTARLSTRLQPWSADHALAGVTLVPGTAVVELALQAARRVDRDAVGELVLESPLALPENGGVLAVQVAADADGGFAVHARPEGSDEPWTRHATGVLAQGSSPAPNLVWPPVGATPVAVSYDRLHDVGYEYGPAFHGLRRAWRLGDEILAEVALPGDDAAAYGVHPALLDAALHAILLDDTAPRMPFSWHDVRLHATGAADLRVRITPTGSTGFALHAVDATGRPVVTGTLTFRAAHTAEKLEQRVWEPATADPGRTTGTVAVLGPPHPALPVPTFATLADLLADGPAPDTLVVHHPRSDTALPEAVHTALAEHVDLLRTCLTTTDAHLVLLTRDATTATPDLVAAGLWGLWGSVAAEHPDRTTLLDTDHTTSSRDAVATAVATNHPRLALRAGVPHVPVLREVPPVDVLVPPAGAWKLDTTGTAGTATPDDLVFVPVPEVPLTALQVRIAVRAAGLNFVDVITSMGMFPGTAGLGREFAGTVTEVGADVTGIAVGDRVLGIVGITDSAIGPVVATDHRLVTRFPADWSFAQAASMPIAFLTAYYGLVVLGGLRAGESVLVHAATGGVGLAAGQLARHVGATVLATAHPDKHVVLAESGVPWSHLASSRDLGFETAFADGVDVVLNSLTGEFVDASLRLLPRGGRFLEMGKLDVRRAEEVAAAHPGVLYDAFDILDVDPDLIAAMLTDLLALFASGALRPLPVTTWDVGRAREAFRHFRDARHIGKLVLTFPAPADGTTLITGGTGTLGGALARHLVESRGVRRLHLTSRRGSEAPGAAELVADLAALGADVTVSAHDLADADQVADLLASLPDLVGVVHAAGVLRDATLAAVTPEHLDAVLRPKVDAAWHLHRLTRHLDLAEFTLYSSVAGVLGLPGQGNYAAANAVLDALARHRNASGRAGQAIAWGLWASPSGMSDHLAARDVERMAEAGVAPLSTPDGLALYDAARLRPEADLVAAATSRPRPRRAGPVTSRPTADVRERLAELPQAERESALLAWVREQAAVVLRLAEPDGVLADRALRDLGFDSLTSVELRNRLNTATGLRLPVTAVFDHPTPTELAAFVGGLLFPAEAPASDLDAASPEELLRLIDEELGAR